MKKTNYIKFHQKEERDGLDLNTIRDPSKIVMFPRHMYGGEVMVHRTYRYGDDNSSYPRDSNFSYIIGKERGSHPDHFTRFSYNRAPYGYGSGHVPGKYLTTSDCVQDTLPKDMAPQRFYHPVHSGCFSSLSQARIDYTKGKLPPT
jgi:hypothetical protein